MGFVLSSFQNYIWGNRIWFLYPVALVVIAVLGGRKARQIFIWPLAAQLLTIFNPLLAGTLAGKLGFASRYLRMFWMLEYYLVIGFACVLAAKRMPQRILKAAVPLLTAAAVLLLGTPVFYGKDTPSFVKAVNTQFTENEYLALGGILHADGIERPRVLLPEHVLQTYRMYDPSVKSVVNRVIYQRLAKFPDAASFDAGKNVKPYLKKVLRVYWYNDMTVTHEQFLKASRKRKIDYYVIFRDSELNGYFALAGLVFSGETGAYRVWRVPPAQ